MSYYEVLGVSSDATDQQIKEAYRREAMKWHPDRHESAEAKAEATRRFKEIAEAYRHLRDPIARAAYDQHRQQEAHTHAGARQSDQAGQQRRGESANTGDQQRSEQNARRDQSSHAAPDFDEETMSGEEANNMFFEQMVDLAFELAGRGFPQENIVKALIALGCPESMARAVATLAAQRGKPSSDGFSERTSARDAPALKKTELPPQTAGFFKRAWLMLLFTTALIAVPAALFATLRGEFRLVGVLLFWLGVGRYAYVRLFHPEIIANEKREEVERQKREEEPRKKAQRFGWMTFAGAFPLSVAAMAVIQGDELGVAVFISLFVAAAVGFLGWLLFALYLRGAQR